jgi:diguanylate cyclase (GGDEF)-like protein
VEFAVPYYTPDGRRVFSGAYELNQTPLAAVLKSITPVRGSRAFVVDGSGGIVASNPQLAKGESTMPGVLAAAYHKASKGNYDSRTGRGYYFTSAAIAGTPWSLVVTAPRDTLFAPVRGTASTVPWIALGLVALLAGGANWMMLRLLAGRHRLHVLNTALASSARTDPLTKLPNRRHLDESLAAALSSGQRHRLQVSVLVMDIDHFKHVNDTYGHTAGDRVLEHVADLLQNAFRGHDIVGRWGGEEFLAVLPHTDGPAAALIGERLRRLVQDTPFTNKAGGQIRTTLSIGYATGVVGGDKDELIHRADQALYQAKTGGRNRVRGEHSDLPLPAPEQLALVSGVLRSSSS